jgi:hypothetical protein
MSSTRKAAPGGAGSVGVYSVVFLSKEGETSDRDRICDTIWRAAGAAWKREST